MTFSKCVDQVRTFAREKTPQEAFEWKELEFSGIHRFQIKMNPSNLK